MRSFIVALFTISLIWGQEKPPEAPKVSTEAKLSLQLAETELALVQAKYENASLTLKVLETTYNQKRELIGQLQTTICKTLGGKGKEDCTYSPNGIELKKPAPTQ